MSLPYFQVDTRNEHLKTLSGKHGSLRSDFDQKLDFSWIFHGHGLEGVVLEYQEISVALNERVTAENPPLPLHQEIRNLGDAITLLREYAHGKKQKERFGKAMLHAFYDVLVNRLRGIPEGDGIRKEDGRYGAYYHKCCPHTEIEARLKKLFLEINQTNIEEVHPLVTAAKIHFSFMRLMPFGRFSGKIIRLFTNLWLMRHNYPPAIIHTVERARYYEALAWEEESQLLVLIRDSMNTTVESALLYIEEGISERRRKREARKAKKLEQEQRRLEKQRELERAMTSRKPKKPKKTKSSKTNSSEKDLSTSVKADTKSATKATRTPRANTTKATISAKSTKTAIATKPSSPKNAAKPKTTKTTTAKSEKPEPTIEKSEKPEPSKSTKKSTAPKKSNEPKNTTASTKPSKASKASSKSTTKSTSKAKPSKASKAKPSKTKNPDKAEAKTTRKAKRTHEK